MHHVVGDLETHVRQFRRDFGFDEARNHASDVHGNDLVELVATIVGLRSHVGHNHVGEDILADLRSVCRNDLFGALAGMRHDFVAAVVLVLVKDGNDAPVGDHHRHFHLDVKHFAALAVFKSPRRHPVV